VEADDINQGIGIGYELPKKKIKKPNENHGKGPKIKPRPIKVVAYNIPNLEKLLNRKPS